MAADVDKNKKEVEDKVAELQIQMDNLCQVCGSSTEQTVALYTSSAMFTPACR